ncbi:MAG: putative peptidoglycan lipid flippase, partial [Petrotoga sp.]|nr:putative peptidoglycan lipid flippase [Petrotoga sp.]
MLSTISKFLGFFREIALSYFYGASQVSDAYLISITIPAVVFAFVGAALSTSYIPLFASVEKERGSKGAIKFSNNVVNFLLIFACIVAVVGLVFTREIV